MKVLVIAVASALLMTGCGSSDDPAPSGGHAATKTTASSQALAVRALPDTPDVPEVPISGLWLAVVPAEARQHVSAASDVVARGGQLARTDDDGRASLQPRQGDAFVCSLGASDKPQQRVAWDECAEVPLSGALETRLQFGEAGITVG